MRGGNLKMLEILVVGTLFVFLACGVEFGTVDAASDGKPIPAIYWNTSDPIFADHANYVQYVHIGQKMDIICPLRGRNQPDGNFYFILYQVSKENYESCSTKGQKKLLTCDTPKHEKKYTFLFQDITPSPWGLTFSEKETYYFISTSDGTLGGINNMKGGACTEKNMKLMITVNQHENKEIEKHRYPKPVIPNIHKVKTTSPPTYINTVRHVKSESKDEQISNEEKNDNRNEVVSSNGLVIGVVLGACAVLFIVLLAFLGYKVYRKRKHVKKYQSPGISVSRGGTPQTQVTLLPISSHQAAQLRVHSVGRNSIHHPLEIQPPPPPYNESMLDHAGSTMEV